MNKDVRDRILMGLVAVLVGIYLILEGMQITSFGKPSANTPYWLIAMVGLMFFVGGIAVIMGNAGRWNALAAAFIAAIMAVTMGWVSLFGDSSNMSGSASTLSHLTGISLDRILFGLVSLACLVVCFYAGKDFFKITDKKRGQRP